MNEIEKLKQENETLKQGIDNLIALIKMYREYWQETRIEKEFAESEVKRLNDLLVEEMRHE